MAGADSLADRPAGEPQSDAPAGHRHPGRGPGALLLPGRDHPGALRGGGVLALSAPARLVDPEDTAHRPARGGGVRPRLRGGLLDADGTIRRPHRGIHRAGRPPGGMAEDRRNRARFSAAGDRSGDVPPGVPPVPGGHHHRVLRLRPQRLPPGAGGVGSRRRSPPPRRAGPPRPDLGPRGAGGNARPHPGRRLRLRNPRGGVARGGRLRTADPGQPARSDVSRRLPHAACPSRPGAGAGGGDR